MQQYKNITKKKEKRKKKKNQVNAMLRIISQMHKNLVKINACLTEIKIFQSSLSGKEYWS